MPDQLNTNKLRVEDATDAPTVPWSSVRLVGKGKLTQAHPPERNYQRAASEKSLVTVGGAASSEGWAPSESRQVLMGWSPSLGAPQRVLTFVGSLSITHTHCKKDLPSPEHCSEMHTCAVSPLHILLMFSPVTVEGGKHHSLTSKPTGMGLDLLSSYRNFIWIGDHAVYIATVQTLPP